VAYKTSSPNKSSNLSIQNYLLSNLLATGLGFTTYQKPWGSLQNILLSADVEP
jgi:hypothetical protein